jgi:peptidoglycan/LPS O-acetylase OafA/YrhL
MYWPALDGLRGLAVLLVVLSHVGLLGEQANAGYAGVVIFFVLSGFLITTLLRTSVLEGRGHLLAFYATRAVRLWPALLLLIVVVSAVWLAQGRAPGAMGTQAALAAFYLENFFHGRHPGLVLAHTWSLSVEEQFYLLWPFVLPAVLRLGTRMRALVIIGGVAASALIHAALVLLGAGNQAYASLPSNAFALLAGCGLALLPLPSLARWWWTAVGVGGLAVSLFALPGLPMGDYLAPFGVVAGAALLVVRLRSGDALFGSRPARYLGRVSYAWYLWHWPLLLFTATMGHPLAGSAVALGSLGVAAASTHLLEEPVRRAFRRRLAARRAARTAAGPAVVDEPIG